MKIFNFFRGKRNKEAVESFIKGLLSVGKIDSHLSYTELKYVYQVANKYSFSKDRVRELIRERRSERFEYSEKYKFQHLKGIVAMISIDGKISIKELSYCKNLALKMGYDSRVVDDLLEEFKKKDSELVLI
ncbi:hypothetical protein OO013_08905 [Mangrovivirga sp. M17]|uniref:Tellurite resistance protein TerB n=1 Tax=Mangrovivirga halotolerans TaxID=2993936 RepID=A0ABT3RQA7_9BACT|nr:hypothetical protein [Mangrovivirga halotolerans]MCX2743981.1 hypothetical protein [Mangrovivirga halotolerans]